MMANHSSCPKPGTRLYQPRMRLRDLILEAHRTKDYGIRCKLRSLMPGRYPDDMNNVDFVTMVPCEEHYERRIRILGNDPSLTICRLVSLADAIRSFDVEQLVWYAATSKAEVAKQFADRPEVNQRLVMARQLSAKDIQMLFKHENPLGAVKALEPFLPHMSHLQTRPHSVITWYTTLIQQTHLGAQAVQILNFLADACGFSIMDLAAYFPPSLVKRVEPLPQPLHQPPARPRSMTFPFTVNRELCLYLAATLPARSWTVNYTDQWMVLVKAEAWEVILSLFQNDSDLIRTHEPWVCYLNDLIDMDKLPALVELLQFLEQNKRRFIRVQLMAYTKLRDAGFSELARATLYPGNTFYAAMHADDASLLEIDGDFESVWPLDRAKQLSAIILRFGQIHGRGKPLPASASFDRMIAMCRAMDNFSISISYIATILLFLGAHTIHTRPPVPNAHACYFHDLLDLQQTAWNHGVFSEEFILAAQPFADARYIRVSLPALVHHGDEALIRSMYRHGRNDGVLSVLGEDCRRTVVFSIVNSEMTRASIQACRESGDVSDSDITFILGCDVANWNEDGKQLFGTFLEAVQVITKMIPSKLPAIRILLTGLCESACWSRWQSIIALRLTVIAERFRDLDRMKNTLSNLKSFENDLFIAEEASTAVVCMSFIGEDMSNEAVRNTATNIILESIRNKNTRTAYAFCEFHKLSIKEVIESNWPRLGLRCIPDNNVGVMMRRRGIVIPPPPSAPSAPSPQVQEAQPSMET